MENLGLSGGGLGLDRPRRSYCDYSSSFFQTWAALAHDSSRLEIHQWPKHSIKVTSTLTKSCKGLSFWRFWDCLGVAWPGHLWGGTPGRQILRDSLKRKCSILVSPGPEVILENLALSGSGLGLDRPRRSYCDYSSSFFQTWAALARDSSRLEIHQ